MSDLAAFLPFWLGDSSSKAPAITIVSPSPDVDPGEPGGFPADWEAARLTPIVVRISDVFPGNVYQCVTAKYPGAVEEIVVYRTPSFVGSFSALSTSEVDGADLVLSILPSGGWPSSSDLGNLRLHLDAVDAAGNVT